VAKGELGKMSRVLLRNDEQVLTQRIPESCSATALLYSRASDFHWRRTAASSLCHS
jgi:hypothetical protein